MTALGDDSPIVQGGAAEALGLIGDADRRRCGRAARVPDRAVRRARASCLATDADARRDLPASAFRLAIYALVRLKAYDQLAAAVLDASGQPKVRWWPVAYAFQRIDDKRALAGAADAREGIRTPTRARLPRRGSAD